MGRLIVGIVIGLSLAYGLYSVHKHYQQPPPEVTLEICEKINQVELICTLSDGSQHITNARFRSGYVEDKFKHYDNVSYKF